MTWMMFTVILCLDADPTVCREHEKMVRGNLTPFQCMHFGQQEISKTIKRGEHVKKWTCGKPSVKA